LLKKLKNQHAGVRCKASPLAANPISSPALHENVAVVN